MEIPPLGSGNPGSTLLWVEVEDQGMDEMTFHIFEGFFKRTRSCWETCPYSPNACH